MKPMQWFAVLCLVFSAQTVAILSAQDAAKPDAKAEGEAKKPAASKTEVPKTTTDLVARCRKVWERYYEQRFDALSRHQQFDSDKAWTEAAKAGDYKDREEFEAAVAAGAKADTVNFQKLYDAVRKELEKAHLEKLKEANKGK